MCISFHFSEEPRAAKSCGTTVRRGGSARLVGVTSLQCEVDTIRKFYIQVSEVNVRESGME